VSGHSNSEILVSSEGLEIRVSGNSGIFRRKPVDTRQRFRWVEITRVSVFKRDCFTVDLLCLALELNGRQYTELNEEMAGWSELIEALPVYLPGALPLHQWWEKVMFPAFERCWTQLYPRQAD
jgi:hypothetical protein